MATSLPWSVKGVDPRTRDAAKAAARRAGMTLGEWLDNKIREEAAETGPEQTAPEQLDIAALSERLAKLSQGQMDTSPHAAASAAQQGTSELSRSEIDAVINQAAAVERLTRESSAKTAGALDSITRWIEKTESRITSSERAAAERQERATSVIADAIKTMGERLVEMERKASEVQQAQAQPTPMPAPRLAFSRDGLAEAVNDIRTRQRALDVDGQAQPARRSVPENRIAALRQDLRELSNRIVPASPEAEVAPQRMRATPAQHPAPASAPIQGNPIEAMLADLGARLDKLGKQDRLEPIMKPLARIESDVSRLSQERSAEGYQRFELEIAHLAAKVDALAARGGDRSVIAPVLRDIAELRDIVQAPAADPRMDSLSRQISSLSTELAQLREAQPDGRDIRSLSQAIEDVRDAILSDRAHDRQADPAQLTSLSRQIESLADKIETLPAMRPEVINAQAEQLAARLNEMDASGRGVSHVLSDRIEALVIRLEDMAGRQPDQLESRIDALQESIETLAEQGPVAVTRQIEALAGRIESLAAASNLSQMISEGKGPQVARVDLRPIEDMLRGLAEKIDEAGRPGAETDAFDALEQQISGLAQRLDAAAATRSAETGIERTLQDLVVHLQTLRQDTTAAAERAARAAMADMGTKGGPASGIAEISNLLSGLRDTHVSSGRETQDAIGAVHQTLETVISRLASIEAELAAERQGPAPRPVMPPRHAEQAQSAARTPEPAASVSIAEGDRIVAERPRAGQPEASSPVAASLDLPLEPGSGRPRVSTATAPQDAQSVRQSLIAAARRSAKAATEAATTAPAATSEPTKGGGRLKEIMEKRRKPLLLGLAAIVLAMGTAHVVTGALQGGGGTAKPVSAEAVDVPAAPTAPAPVPATPAKDQTSALPPVTAPTISAAPSFMSPAQAAITIPETAPAAEPLATASAPPAQTAVLTVTGIDDLPTGLGSVGLRKAALAGDARAVYEVASRAADGPGPGRDPKLALRLFERAAVAGLAPAQFRLGNMFEKGIGTTRDASLARVWYTRAAERGNAKAMHNLAVLHAEGAAGKPDYATATEWFRKAAELGVRDSQYNLAILLGRGLGAPTDLGQSYLWFSIAAAQGDEDASRKRDEVSQRLSPSDLAAAKAAAESWKPKALEAAANDVTPPGKGWDEAPSATKKPAKPAHG
ncbi:localization factor PodJL [Bosea sp. OK403]|uniref:SEL1-like repeat protein n=1 Tax=Bosea sp. OK403 TaxID=1855286 RepID=UPI0008E15956|nr:SEL1-like repeat protein [Bosea sp. OK403]SFI72314.1 localization factor PodJL [Bosea sp. OK403]